MTRTVAGLVRATIERTSLPRTKVEQTAREIQNAGLLRLGRLSLAQPRDFANLLLALSADSVRKAPATVTRYADLKRLVESDEPRAGDALEALITAIWSGDRDAADKTIRIVQSWPEMILADSNDRQHGGAHFYEDNQYIEAQYLTRVRRSIEIPGRVIAEIGSDLGIRGCAYAI